jgi:predicted O-linked N-acetylglucosamine transferase (SPINDLY family)
MSSSQPGADKPSDMNSTDAMPTLRPAQDISKTQPHKTTAHTATASPQKQHMGKEKPVVHFPDGAMPSADETSRVGMMPMETAPSQAAEQPAVMPSPTAMGADNASAMSNASWSAASDSMAPTDTHIIPTAMSPMSDATPAEALRHYNRAAYYGQLNRMNEAITEYKDAIAANPAFADAYVGLSTAYMRKNDWENVIASAQKALNLQTAFLDSANLLQAQFNLGAAHCAADDFIKANTYYEQIRAAHSPLAERLWGYLVKTCKP